MKARTEKGPARAWSGATQNNSEQTKREREEKKQRAEEHHANICGTFDRTANKSLAQGNMDVWVFIKVAVQALPKIIKLELPNR